MKRIALAVALLGILGAACGTAGAQSEPAAKTVTVTAAPATPTVDPDVQEVADEIANPPATPDLGDYDPAIVDESRACNLMDRALGLPPYSIRWDDVMYDAVEAANSDILYTKLSRANDTIWEPGYDYERVATERLQDAYDKWC
jgi:hypothetical protein